jgi:hypothetical protein
MIAVASIIRMTLLVFAVASITGCVKVTDSGRSKPTVKVKDSGNAGPNRESPDVVIVPPAPPPTEPIFSERIDPCASKLHDIEGLLLKHYVAYRRLPNQLADLVPLVDSSQQADFNCPLCGKQYIYVSPGGAPVAGQVLAYAPVPAKDGRYRVILLRPAAGSSMGSLPDVTSFSPDQMKPYLSRAAAQP